MPGRVEGKVAIVTGGGSGIGAATAEALHSEGAIVVVADVSGRQEDVVEKLGERALAIQVDVTSDDAVKAMVETTITEFASLDVICNNAGIGGEIAPIADCSLENYDRIMSTNARSVFLGMRHALPPMIEHGGGSIINTASIAGLVATPLMPAYGCSKAAVIGLTRCAAVDYAHAGVRANAICPGVTRTPILKSVETTASDEFAAAIGHPTAMTPLQRLAEPQEIASAMVFLASDESSFVTGAAIPVDGGYTTI